ncbi:MAG TPA: hypothetical protein VK541_20240 [Pedobacter sp.]|uniref:hypothetical protein n=1 Tax=Pedobacter sp. TaxID=1411316 RepID=UPI002B56B519|nr:hypothetical protein [Pedobacter sp.]HMI04829.1 hypothetical protein [Pedobacter sp.]
MKLHNKVTLVISFVFCISLFSFSCSSQDKHDGSVPIEIVEELGITRTDLIKWAKKVNPELEFSEAGRIDGLPHYEARDKYKTIVQLVGEEHMIRQAKWTYTFTTDPELNKKLVMNIAYFAYIFEPKKMPDWIKKEMELVGKDLTQEFVGEKQRIGFNKMAQLVYSPKQKVMSVIFTTR